MVWEWKEREIAYSAHLDSHIYAYYSQLLVDRYETELERLDLRNTVLAFRALGQSNIHFARHAFQEIERRTRKTGECYAVGFDISKFFDHLDHRILKEQWATLIGSARLPADHFSVYRSLTRWCRVEKVALYQALGISIHNPRKLNSVRICEPAVFRDVVKSNGLLVVNDKPFGIPQGSPISAVLSNIYMLTFDQRMRDFAASVGAEYLRYCDDMLFIASPSVSNELKTFTRQELLNMKLTLNEDKTEESVYTLVDGKIRATKPLQYLGFTFDGGNARIRPNSYQRYFDKMRRGVNLARKTREKRNSSRVRRGHPRKAIHLKKLYRQYSYLGRSNFVSYGHRSAQLLGYAAIKRQMKPLWNRLRREISG
jgi:hypothetical protein